MQEHNKEELVEEIKHLISVDGSVTHINPNYLEYFELDELIDIKNELEGKKTSNSSIKDEYLSELYEKCK
jgi:hypothetical protein